MKMKAFRLVDTDLCERFFGNPIKCMETKPIYN